MITSLQTTNAVFRAFADETRLRLLNLLLDGELCVCDLCAVLEVLQPSISRHLGYLHRAGLVMMRRDGKWKYYALPARLTGLRATLVACVRSCLRDIDVLREDRERLSQLRKGDCCGSSRGCT